jgi:eukaryotic-like serine/threonine-protein kinase
MTQQVAPAGLTVGRYVLYDEIAAGGMATIHLGRLCGPAGFARTVAIKRLHPQFAKDPEFATMFLGEAQLAARIRHPNVAATIDVVALGSELLLVMDYVQGDSLSHLKRASSDLSEIIPPRVAVAVMVDVLYGLQAAHDAKGENGEPLGIVHRDVSPQNIMVGSDGISRVLDFGIAKAAHQARTTRDDIVKGKLAYMAPEQLQRQPIDRRTDIFAASIVLWEILTGERLFHGEDAGGTVAAVLGAPIPAPSEVTRSIPRALEEAVLRGLARDPAERFASARDEVGAWVDRLAGRTLARRAARIAEIESTSSSTEALVEDAPAKSGVARRPGSSTQLLKDEPGQEPVVSVQTDLSSVTPNAGRARMRRTAMIAGVGALAVVVTALALLRASRSPVVAQPVQGSSALSVDPAPPLASVAPPPSVEASAIPRRSSPTDTVQSPSVGPPGPRAHPPAVPPKGHATCSPPYYFEDQGVKRFKPQCI